MEGCCTDVDEVRRDLHRVTEREPERLNARQSPRGLAHRARDGLRGLERPAQVEVERDERTAHSDQHGSRPRVELRGAVRRRELRGGDPPAELLEPAAAVERRLPTRADVPVEKDRQPELLPDSPRDRPRDGRRPPEVLGRERDDRNDVRGTDSGVDAPVSTQVDPPSRLVDPGDEPVLEGALVADERDDRAVVVGIDVNVENPPACARECRRDRVEGGASSRNSTWRRIGP